MVTIRHKKHLHPKVSSFPFFTSRYCLSFLAVPLCSVVTPLQSLLDALIQRFLLRWSSLLRLPLSPLATRYEQT